MNVVLTPTAVEEQEALSEPIHSRVLRILERLENWPEVSGAKPLSGNLAGRWRMRTGDYRVQFRIDQQSIDGEQVVVEHIGHRSGFYDN